MTARYIKAIHSQRRKFSIPCSSKWYQRQHWPSIHCRNSSKDSRLISAAARHCDRSSRSVLVQWLLHGLMRKWVSTSTVVTSRYCTQVSNGGACWLTDKIKQRRSAAQHAVGISTVIQCMYLPPTFNLLTCLSQTQSSVYYAKRLSPSNSFWHSLEVKSTEFFTKQRKKDASVSLQIPRVGVPHSNDDNTHNSVSCFMPGMCRLHVDR